MSTTRVRVLIFSTLALLLAACGTAATLTPFPTMTPLATITRPRTEVVVMVITATPDPNSTATANATATYCAANACPTSTLNEDQRRATQIIEEATATAIYCATHICLTNTPTSISQGRATEVSAGATAAAAAIQTATSYALTPTVVLDHDQMRATQIIVGATATSSYILTATTQAMLYGGGTPEATLSSDDWTRVRQGWLYQLQAAAGFSHPAFDTLLDQIMGTTRYFPRTSHYILSFELDPQVERVVYEGVPYVAMIVHNRLDYISTEFMMFRYVDNQPVYIPDPIQAPSGYIMGFVYDFNWTLHGDNRYVGGFADRNGNGYPDIAIDTSTHGSSPFQVLLLLEIQPGGLVVDLTPQSSLVETRSFIDINNDGILEFDSWGCIGYPYFEYCSYDAINLHRYFGWNGTAYVNISSTLGDDYYPAVSAFWNSLPDDAVCVLPSAEMYAMLVDYIAWEQLAQAWAVLEPRLHWDACSPEVFAEHYEEMFTLQDWVSRNLLWSSIYP